MACQYVQSQPTATTRPDPSRRLVLVLDQDLDRLDAAARAIKALAPDARVSLVDTIAAPAPGVVADGGREAPDAILVRADPGSWTAASMLAAYGPVRLGRPVDGVLVAEGPLENYPVVITDFPGLRLLRPDDQASVVIAELVHRSLVGRA
jgi:hypothetical protein